MASFDEFVSAVQSNIEALKQAQTGMDTAKQQAEELSSQFQGLGAEAMATGSQGVKQGMEEAQNSVNPVITHLERLITQAQGMKGLNSAGGAGASNTHTRPPPTPLDAAPLDLKEPTAKIGDPLTAPEEVDATEDSDRPRYDRFGRAFSRKGASEVEKVAKQHVEAGKATGDSYKKLPPSPSSGQLHATVGVNEQASIGQTPSQDTGLIGLIGTIVLGTSVVFQASGYMSKRRRDKKHDQRS